MGWRWGERHFYRQLVDADLAQNVGNWQPVAGYGADAAPYVRIFNAVLQARKFAPKGTISAAMWQNWPMSVAAPFTA
jgi:deoxyribodipyrimidine photo-lyase